jgi:hypothetical protein
MITDGELQVPAVIEKGVPYLLANPVWEMLEDVDTKEGGFKMANNVNQILKQKALERILKRLGNLEEAFYDRPFRDANGREHVALVAQIVFCAEAAISAYRDYRLIVEETNEAISGKDSTSEPKGEGANQ